MRLPRAARSAAVFLTGFVPMALVFAAHECASAGFFLSKAIVCDDTVFMSPASPTWARIWLVLFYYVVSKYCILIESPVRIIKA